MMCRKKTLAKIAYQYYIYGRSQNDIAAELNVNRATISRMLKEARDSEIVSIAIDYDDENVLELESFLKQHFQLKNVIIATPSEKSSTHKNEALYEEAAEYIQTIIKNGDKVGLSWGRTISQVIGKMGNRQAKQATFVPIAGGSSPANIKYHVNTMVHEIASKYSGKSCYINTQVIQEKNAAKNKAVMLEPKNELLPYWDNLDIAVVGIGGTLKQKSIWRDVLSPEDFEELRLREAVGDCCCQFFDKDGKILKGELYDRTISLPLEKLSNVKFSIGIAANKNKAQAIHAMLKRKYINVLVTDYETGLILAQMVKKTH
ncbi:sugar-binding transcriptional regulator [Enterococcus avium]|uniref:sugar-binding transcriptional regulator n=1 Tax=Enterococcus avium TaxID=33945 RepID=UPI00159E6755|nr:sugar-binding transcriptional regulator [Enterococcus avium]NVN75497.1 sugar-binding transcriptional regulator [Enterococcus avium]